MKKSSNRKINNGYFAILIELSNKINQSNEESIQSFLTDDWNNFYNDKILNWSNLFTRKLCYEEKNTNFFNNNYFENYYDTAGKQVESEQSENQNNDESNKENEDENVIKLILQFI